MVVNGVDGMGHRGGILSATHGNDVVGETAEAFRATIRALKEERELV